MAKIFLISFGILLMFQSYSCWILTDINSKMLPTNVFDDGTDEIRTAVLQNRISLIFPGTKWCGAGNIAENYDDLGPEKEADMCCREHDFCPDIIEGGGTKYNLTNPVFYTRLNCTCDNKFHDCLKSANTKTAKIIGNIYFNSLQTKCFREDYPKIKCIKRGGWLKTKCAQYEYDTDGEQVYQWFDVEDF